MEPGSHEILRRAREQLIDPTRWWDGSRPRYSDDSLCLGQALIEAAKTERGPISAHYGDACAAVQVQLPEWAERCIPSFNDQSPHDEVIGALERAMLAMRPISARSEVTV